MSQTNEPNVTWTLERLLDLDSDEHDYQEFKSTPYLEAERGCGLALCRTVFKTAFCIFRWWRWSIFIGIDDYGQIDGGVSTQQKRWHTVMARRCVARFGLSKASRH